MEANQHPPATQTTIGFLGYREFDDGKVYRGAILLTDEWSKPLEFRCTAPEDTYEEIIFKLLERKQRDFNEIIDSMSAEREPSENLAFAIADTLFAKYGLKPIQRKPASDAS